MMNVATQRQCGGDCGNGGWEVEGVRKLYDTYIKNNGGYDKIYERIVSGAKNYKQFLYNDLLCLKYIIGNKKSYGNFYKLFSHVLNQDYENEKLYSVCISLDRNLAFLANYNKSKVKNRKIYSKHLKFLLNSANKGNTINGIFDYIYIDSSKKGINLLPFVVQNKNHTAIIRIFFVDNSPGYYCITLFDTWARVEVRPLEFYFRKYDASKKIERLKRELKKNRSKLNLLDKDGTNHFFRDILKDIFGDYKKGSECLPQVGPSCTMDSVFFSYVYDAPSDLKRRFVELLSFVFKKEYEAYKKNNLLFNHKRKDTNHNKSPLKRQRIGP